MDVGQAPSFPEDGKQWPPYLFLLCLHTPPKHKLRGFIIHLPMECHTNHTLTLRSTFSSPSRVRPGKSSHCQSVLMPQRPKVKTCMAFSLEMLGDGFTTRPKSLMGLEVRRPGI